MNAMLAMSLVTLTLHAAAAAAMFAIARAPGWERVRIALVLAVTAGAYSLTNLFGSLGAHSPQLIGIATTINLTVAAVHAAAWLWYTFSDRRAAWRSMPRVVRALAASTIAFAALLSITGSVVDREVLDRVDVPALGLSFSQARLTASATLAATLILVTLLVSFACHLRRARAGVPGAAPIAAGFAVFVLASIAEGLVAIGVLEFIYIAEVGYVALVVPVAAKLLRRFVADAHRLSQLSDRLADEADRAVGERDAAWQALAEQEHMAALGRVASGLGHEVNNPLQYLQLSLEELRDETRGPRTETADSALANAFEASARIRRVVDSLRAYARRGTEQLETVDLNEAVRAALRLASPQLVGTDGVRPLLGHVEPVRGVESKLVQLIANGMINAAQAVRVRPPGTLAEIRVMTRMAGPGVAELEIRDNGPGFAREVLDRVGEPFLTTRREHGGTGLGIFVMRGVASAHGARITFENAATGGAVVRLRIPTQGTTAVASTSTSAPTSINAETSTAVMAG